METKLQNIFKYFDHFGYKPSLEEVHTFFPVKISKKRLKSYLNSTRKYTLGGYGNNFKVESSKFKVSLDKIARVRKYLAFVAKLPQIRLVGFSGSIAMLNAKNIDDVDLFIITAKNRIWTTRFITNLIAWTFGLKRGRGKNEAQNKICLNLFFDESSLLIRRKSHSNYMAHEVLQMVPILDVNRTYRRFLLRNDWIRVFCPNVDPKSYFPYHFSHERFFSKKIKNHFELMGDMIEIILKKVQMLYMRKPIGDERIESGQLWFHPRDYSRIIGE